MLKILSGNFTHRYLTRIGRHKCRHRMILLKTKSWWRKCHFSSILRNEIGGNDIDSAQNNDTKHTI